MHALCVALCMALNISHQRTPLLVMSKEPHPAAGPQLPAIHFSMHCTPTLSLEHAEELATYHFQLTPPCPPTCWHSWWATSPIWPLNLNNAPPPSFALQRAEELATHHFQPTPPLLSGIPRVWPLTSVPPFVSPLSLQHAEELATYHFQLTPPMSTYLLAFVVGNLTSVTRTVPGGPPGSAERNVSVWGTPDRWRSFFLFLHANAVLLKGNLYDRVHICIMCGQCLGHPGQVGSWCRVAVMTGFAFWPGHACGWGRLKAAKSA